MLETKEEGPFIDCISEQTQRFAQISKEIIDIEQQLHQVGKQQVSKE